MPATWRLKEPAGGGIGTADRIRANLESRVPYKLTGAAGEWSVQSTGAPPNIIRQLPLRITRAGVIAGDFAELEREARRWPAAAVTGNEAVAATALQQLEAKVLEQLTFLTLVDAYRLADTVLKELGPGQLGTIPRRAAEALLRWFPNGQFIIWGKEVKCLEQQQAIHLLATAALLGLDAAEENNRVGRLMWERGEDIFLAHPGPLFVNLLDGGCAGMAFESVNFIFVFEFSGYLPMPALDAVHLRHFHSLALTNYQPASPSLVMPALVAGALQQDAMREWFVAGFNRLASYALTWENFRTADGYLQPALNQQILMTLGRLLATTAHLLASDEPSTRLTDFWDLLDLYAELRLSQASDLLVRSFWEDTVIGALRGLPGDLGPSLSAHAEDIYAGWVRESVAGVTQPSRKQVDPDHLLLGPNENQSCINPSNFFAKFIGVRRNTLHSYQLHRLVEFRDYLAIHDGSLPERLAEWGRYMLFALLSRPEVFLGRYAKV